MRATLLALLAARLAVGNPIARPDGGHGSHGGMAMGPAAPPAPAASSSGGEMADMPGMNHGGHGGMNMGGGKPAAVLIVPKPVEFPPVERPESPLVTAEKFQFNNLEAPFRDMSQLYFEENLNPAQAMYDDSQIKTVKYGPYKVPGMGMIENTWDMMIEKPCTDCYITALQADLQDEEGNSINVAEGAWLHHIVLYNGMGFTPFSEKDLVCSHTLLSGYLGWPHRIFASGNERAPIRLNTRYKYGLEVGYFDNFHLLYDLVNVKPVDRNFYVVMHYEYVPRSNKEYKRARMLWLDITGCGTSEAPPVEGAYELKSPGWTSTIEGALLATIGHTHDGGVLTNLYINGKSVCRSDQLYGTKREFYERPGVVNLNTEAAQMGEHTDMMMSTADENMPPDMEGTVYPDPMTQWAPELRHISEVSNCVNFGVLKKGDVVTIGATYNTTAHYMNRNMHSMEKTMLSTIYPGGNEKYAAIMGISPVYVAEGLMSLP